MKSALFLSASGILDQELIDLENIGGFDHERDLIYRHSLGAHELGQFTPTESTMAFCKPLPNTFYDVIAVSRHILLFDSVWVRSWLSLAARALTPSGVMIIPSFSQKLTDDLDLLSEREIVNFLRPKSIERIGAYLRFFGPKPKSIPASVMSWFQEKLPQIFLSLCECLWVEETNIEFLQRYIEESVDMPLSIGSVNPKDLQTDFLNQNFQDIGHYLTYSVQGIYTKLPILRRIVQDQLGGEKRNLSWMDIGAGSGFLGAEAILEGMPFENVISVDKSLPSLMVGVELFNSYRAQLDNRWKLIASSAERLEMPDSSFDVITMLTSLCYVPKAFQTELLERIRKWLKPNGLLVVFEHMRSPKFERDEAIMFSETEIEQLLGKFSSSMFYYASNVPRKKTKQEATGRPCYRVLFNSTR